MKARKVPEDRLFSGAPNPGTLGAWLRFAEKLYGKSGAALGQVASSAHDEALYLLLRTLGLPLDSESAVLSRPLSETEAAAVREIFRRRLADRIPAGYLTQEAWLGEHRFYVDERVIIPRSYFLEIIPQLDGVLLGKGGASERSLRMADVCTGSGCLAILMAHHFPKARIDAIDLSSDALEVAAVNVRDHALERRIKLHRSDVFDSVPKASYDVILSNPPYEPTSHVDALPEEFKREPRLALDGGTDGLDVIRKLLSQARSRLTTPGIVLMEVGGLREAIDREFSRLEPQWLHTEDGADCICLIQARHLRSAKR